MTAEEFATMRDLLKYPNPEGLHPNEAHWRDFARWAIDDAFEAAARTAYESAMNDCYAKAIDFPKNVAKAIRALKGV